MVRLSDAANGYVIANAACVAEVPPVTTPPSVIDNGDAAYAETGRGWLGWSDAASYGGDFRYHTPGDSSDAAVWTFQGVDPTAQYQVYATWSPAANRATDSPFSVYDSGTPLGTTRLDQQFAPTDATIDGQGWESLGVYTATSGTLVVKLGDNADGDVIANAVRIVEVPPVTTPPTIVDNADAGYAESGSGWLGWSDAASYQGGFRYCPAGTGQNAATWSFPALPAGQYLVYATWSPASNRADNAPLTVFDGTTALGTVRVDQQVAPNSSVSDGQTQAAVQRLIDEGEGADGLWDGTTGLYSTTAAEANQVPAGPLMGIRYADAADLGLAPGDTYCGVKIPEHGAIIARYTYMADADLDGQVDHGEEGDTSLPALPTPSLARVLTASAATIALPHGTVSLEQDGGFLFLPNDDYTGPESFPYTATNQATGSSSTATVTLTIENVAPTVAITGLPGSEVPPGTPVNLRVLPDADENAELVGLVTQYPALCDPIEDQRRVLGNLCKGPADRHGFRKNQPSPFLSG